MRNYLQSSLVLSLALSSLLYGAGITIDTSTPSATYSPHIKSIPGYTYKQFLLGGNNNSITWNGTPNTLAENIGIMGGYMDGCRCKWKYSKF